MALYYVPVRGILLNLLKLLSVESTCHVTNIPVSFWINVVNTGLWLFQYSPFVDRNVLNCRFQIHHYVLVAGWSIWIYIDLGVGKDGLRCTCFKLVAVQFRIDAGCSETSRFYSYLYDTSALCWRHGFLWYLLNGVSELKDSIFWREVRITLHAALFWWLSLYVC